MSQQGVTDSQTHASTWRSTALVLLDATCLNRPKSTLLVIAVLVLLALVGAREFRLDASSDALLVEGDPDLARFRDVTTTFGSSEFLIIAWRPSQPLFQRSTLNILDAMAKDAAAVPGVASVFSLLDAPLLRSSDAALADLAGDVPTLRSPKVDLARAQQELTTSPLFASLLVSADGQSTAIQVNLPADPGYQGLLEERAELLGRTDPNPEEAERLDVLQDKIRNANITYQNERRRMVRDLREVRDRYEDSGQVFIGGVPMIADDMLRYVASDLKIFGVLVLLLIVGALWFFFQRIRWVLLPLATAALACLAMVGLLGFTGWPVTVISSNFISLLLIISISLTIHLIVRYRELLERHPNMTHLAMIRESVSSKFMPCLYTALTTMVAFGSLVLADIKPVRDFGLMMTMGVAVSFVVTMVFFPAALALVAKGRPSNTLGNRAAINHELAQIAVRGRNLLLAFCALVAVLAGWGVSRLSLENSFIDYFDDSTEIYQGMVFIDRYLGGTTPLDVILQLPPLDDGSAAAADGDDPFADDFADDFANESADDFEDDFVDDFASDQPGSSSDQQRYWFTADKMATVEAAQAWLEAQPETGKVLSLATLGRIGQQFNDGKALSSVELALVYGEIPPEFRNQLVTPYADPASGRARISVRMVESNRSLMRDEFLNRVRNELPGAAGVAADEVQLTGMMVLFNNMLRSLISSQISTLAFVIGVIFLMFLVMFRRPLLAFLALVPNVLAAACVLGLMGFAGVPLDMMTITIAAIVVGIGVDGSIHYLDRLLIEFAERGNYRDAVLASHGSIGGALYFTSLTVAAGFSVLALSNFVPTLYFGLLTALSMILALVANMTLLPALVLVCKALGPERPTPC